MADDKKTLGSLVTIKGGKRLPKGHSLQEEPNSHPYIRVRDVRERLLPESGLEYVPDAVFPSIRRYIVEENDVIISIVGSVGLVAIIDSRFDNASLTENCAKLSGLNEQDSLYLYYTLKSPFGQEEIRRGIVGAVQPKLPLYNIEKISIPWPESGHRELIVRVLGTLDDKIELNRRMNETLEAMARAIFKDWFVDFGPTRAKAEGRPPYLPPETWNLFPDTLDNEGKPFGWEYNNLGELFNVSIGRTPPRKETEHFVASGQGETWLSIKSMKDVQTFSFSSEEDLTPEAVRRFRIPKIPSGTVLVSFKLTVGRVAITAKDMYSNEAIAHLVAGRKTKIANTYTYCFMKDFDYRTLASTSSIATAVNSKTIKNIRMIVSDTATHDAFVEIAQPLFDRILSNVRESDALAAVRNLLLPKLISGELRVGDIS
ncbi:MAG: hypothetical protein M2R45_00259 [Verrucomicrobia subdivision 3 bacterium]|nr:hypothetical protein [Limisphaerales bacterium]MCS1412981.1 hypothetical protein [Limisphaerales bacterium]